MCRYAAVVYKEHWACFSCRKGFKRRSQCELLKSRLQEPREVKCPHCGGPMCNLGLDFKVPRQSDREQWLKVELLWKHDVAFHSCGCGPGPRPRRLREVEPFVVELRAEATRHQRAWQIAERAEALNQKRRRNAKARAAKRDATLAQD